MSPRLRQTMTEDTGKQDRMDTILDALAASNRIAQQNQQAIVILQSALMTVGILLFVMYLNGKK